VLGPDGIPNIVLTKNAALLTDRLVPIYEAMFEKQLFYKPWKTFTMVVLRKPGKLKYDVAKAYRPIMLLNTMWKVLMAIVADQLMHGTEKYQLLPANHFGGRLGCTTTDAMHLLVHEIKTSWRNGKVTSVLFLDIEGAFPNAVPARLTHNLRKRSVPGKIVSFIHGMLQGRQTALKFDGYKSNPINIENGIGQGDPLSMVIYQYYNADLLEIPKADGEAAIAYVDDSIMAATARTFTETHDMLVDMMTREGGVAD
jgi:Reverse transcriptase (RNA-dependent DNA polymerase)